MNFKKPFSFEILLIFLSTVITNEGSTPWCRNLPDCSKAENRCSCGTEGLQPLKPHEFPWQVGIAFAGRGPFCGGMLISESFVISAAHCFSSFVPDYSKMRILLGVRDYSKLIAAPRKQKIEYVQIHSNFSIKSYIHDIALIKMSSPVQFTSAIKPICLPVSGKKYMGTFITVSGWGRIYNRGPFSSVLMKVDIPIRGDPLCYESLDIVKAKPSLQCGYYDKGQKDACEGDAGSSMMVKDSGRWYFLGLVTSGIGCAKPGIAIYFTTIDRFYQWILSYTEGGYFCESKAERRMKRYKYIKIEN